MRRAEWDGQCTTTFLCMCGYVGVSDAHLSAHKKNIKFSTQIYFVVVLIARGQPLVMLVVLTIGLCVGAMSENSN